MGKPDALSRRSGEEKAGTDAQLFRDGQLVMAMERDTNPARPDTDLAGWERNQEGLLVVPMEHRTTILCHCHDSQVAGHWGRHRTQEIVSRDFVWNRWMEDVAKYVRWARWLPLAEFTHNSTSTTHGYSPFRSLYGFDPRTIHVSEDPSASPAAEEWLDRMTAVHNDIHNTLKHINDKRSRLSLDKA